MALTHTTDHAARAFARLMAQLREVPGWSKLVAIIGRQVQELEDAAQGVLTARSIDNATYEQLEVIGRILKEPRDGADDADYRVRLRAKIRVLRSSGAAPELLHIFKLLLPANTIKFTSIGGAGFVLDIGAIDTAFLAIYQRFLRQAKSAGINAQLSYHDDGGDVDLATVFMFSTNPDPTVTVNDAAHGFGDASSPGTGGHLRGITT